MRAATARKHAAEELLSRAGFQTWHIARSRADLYSLLLIACNRLSPVKPKAALQMLAHSLYSARANHTADKAVPKNVELRGRETIRAEALKIYDGCICPVCSAHWTPEEFDDLSEKARVKLSKTHKCTQSKGIEVKCSLSDSEHDTIKHEIGATAGKHATGGRRGVGDL